MNRRLTLAALLLLLALAACARQVLAPAPAPAHDDLMHDGGDGGGSM
jgi:Spy/CpxP family protein refolding chaperone